MIRSLARRCHPSISFLSSRSRIRPRRCLVTSVKTCHPVRCPSSNFVHNGTFALNNVRQKLLLPPLMGSFSSYTSSALSMVEESPSALSSSSFPDLSNSLQMTGDACYQAALDALEKAEAKKKEIEERKSQEQFEAWKRAQERSDGSNRSARSEGVAIVKTIAKQSRISNKKKKIPENEEWNHIAQSWMEASAFQHEHPKALVRLGNHALEKANAQVFTSDHKNAASLVQEAIELYEKAGLKGSAEGWFNLGHLLWMGYPSGKEETNNNTNNNDGSMDNENNRAIIISPDKAKALETFRKAIDLGDYDAMYFVGVQELALPSSSTITHVVDSGLELIKKAADANHGGALYYLALLHLNGDDNLNIPPCSPTEFVSRLDAAADASNSDALFLRAHSRYHGDDGYEQSYPLALRDFLDAAEGGNADAAVSAGAILHKGGNGVKCDQHRAFELYQKAGEMGSEEGWRNVVACYALGEGVPQSRETAEYIAKTMLKTEE